MSAPGSPHPPLSEGVIPPFGWGVEVFGDLRRGAYTHRQTFEAEPRLCCLAHFRSEWGATASFTGWRSPGSPHPSQSEGLVPPFGRGIFWGWSPVPGGRAHKARTLVPDQVGRWVGPLFPNAGNRRVRPERHPASPPLVLEVDIGLDGWSDVWLTVSWRIGLPIACEEPAVQILLKCNHISLPVLSYLLLAHSAFAFHLKNKCTGSERIYKGMLSIRMV